VEGSAFITMYIMTSEWPLWLEAKGQREVKCSKTDHISDFSPDLTLKRVTIYEKSFVCLVYVNCTSKEMHSWKDQFWIAQAFIAGQPAQNHELLLWLWK